MDYKEDVNTAIDEKKDLYTEENDDQQQEEEIPEEIDEHLRLYGKRAWDVSYGEKCQFCDSRIDEYGFCACGSSGE